MGPVPTSLRDRLYGSLQTLRYRLYGSLQTLWRTGFMAACRY